MAGCSAITSPTARRAERGAEFVDSNHTEVLSLAELGLALQPEIGRPRSCGDAARCRRSGCADVDARLARARHRAVGPRVATVGDNPHSEDRSLADLMHALDLSVLARLVIGRQIRTEYMLPPRKSVSGSPAAMTRLQAAGRRECHRIVGGNDQLATVCRPVGRSGTPRLLRFSRSTPIGGRSRCAAVR